MSGPPDGRYRIQLVAFTRPLIGADFVPAPVTPIITEGQNNIWTVRKSQDGNYTLAILGEIGRPLFSRDDDGNLIGSDEPPPSVWTIRGRDGGPYTIEVPSGYFPTRVWTVNDPMPKSPVTIRICEIPLPNQLWNFIPAFED